MVYAAHDVESYGGQAGGRAGQSGVILSVRFFIGLGFLLFLSVLFFYRFRFCFSYQSVFLPVSDIPNFIKLFFISLF